MNSKQERQKWDQYYASLPQSEEDDNVRLFREEFVKIVQGILPEGGNILEAGCGAGEQSLALAKSGKYRISLLDFSSEALEQARQVFNDVGIKAEFLHQDISRPGKPEYDLVFNAGVLEHYDFGQQVELLKGMASRSKRFVLVLVPNFQNYWYWIWRVHKTGRGEWPFGKEIPALQLEKIFKAADLEFLGNTSLGSSWTESFITGLDGISHELENTLLSIHRSGLLPIAQTGYLVAGLGSVVPISVPVTWKKLVDVAQLSQGSDVETIGAALADALALQVSSARDNEELRNEYLTRLVDLQEQLAQVKEVNTVDLLDRFDQMDQQRSQKLDEKIAQIDEKARQLEKQHQENLFEQIQQLERHYDERLMGQIIDLEQKAARNLSTRIQNIEKDNAAKLLERLKQIEEDKSSDLVAALGEFERQRDIDQAGMVRQIEHDHTGVLVSKIQEIEYLRAQIQALQAPPTRNFRQRWRAFLRKIISKAGLLPVYHALKRRGKQIRHQYRKQVAPINKSSQASYDHPVSVGHPGVPAEWRVVILSYTFFDFDGNNMYFGGAERYVLELAEVIRRLGYYPEIYQCGNGYWVRYYQDLRVTGIDVGGDALRLAEEYKKLEPHVALTIYSPFTLAAPGSDGSAIGISHGVFWDYPEFQANQVAMQGVLTSGKHLDALVSVDTNTINWMRASAADFAAKCAYIPNFVDVDAFDINPDLGEEQIVLLYPRRLYEPRGFWLVVDVLPDILSRYPQVEFHFVGRADDCEADYATELMAQYPGRIEWVSLPPEEMPQAYRRSHITLIPTLHSEGTSLSCLEALASGNAVIATNVGGLPNLILPDYNGLLIDATPQALKHAIEKLIEDKPLREQFSKYGREVAKSFSIERWRTSWREILTQQLDVNESEDFHNQPVVYFPIAPGITWEGIKQRPHHLALQLANAGIETFWQDPDRRQDSPHPLLHILGPDDEFCFTRPIVVIYYPFTYLELDQYHNPIVIYDVLDDISIHAKSDQDLPEGQRAVDYHHKLLTEADLVIASSSVLQQRLKIDRPDILLIPNGIDLEHFSHRDNVSKAKPRPVIGFHGAIAEWFDADLLYDVARLRPEYDFELVGPVSISIDDLVNLPNVFYRDKLDYEDIPNKIAQFDVGVLPFHLNDLTHAVRPLKVLEYLAMGKPVVAVPLDEIKTWPGVFLAASSREFANQLDQALSVREDFMSEEIQNFVSQAAWEQITTPMIDWVRNIVFLANK